VLEEEAQIDMGQLDWYEVHEYRNDPIRREQVQRDKCVVEVLEQLGKLLSA
jgi:hypothetical protein